MIYFIRQDWEFVKIGYGNNPEDRLSQLQVGNPNSLFLWVSFPGGQKEESDLHGFWKQFRVRGEWFQYDRSIEGFIVDWIDSGDMYKALSSARLKSDSAVSGEVHVNGFRLVANA